MDQIEQRVRLAGGGAGLAVLGLAIFEMVRSLGRPSGPQEGTAEAVLRRPLMLAATLLFLAAGVALWRPLPLKLDFRARAAALASGAVLFFGGLLFYLWGLVTLGRMFGPSSSFGVRLERGHRLVTTGPYAHTRHPMYLAVMIAAAGSTILYRTWANLCWAVLMLGLVIRARREDQVLAQTFGQDWAAYANQVSAWRPRPRAGGCSGKTGKKRPLPGDKPMKTAAQ